MRVILTEQEILMAIEDFILDTVKVPDDVRVDIDLKATRGEQGYTAEIDLLQMDEPEGSRAVDDRVEATDEARAEGLDIVGKIDAARAEAKAPRRRGRPAGSKNLPKTPVVGPQDGALPAEPETPASDMIADAVEQNATEVSTSLVTDAPAEDTAVENGAVTAADEAQPEPEPEAPVETPLEVAVEAPAPAADVPATEASTQTKAKRSLFDNTTTAGDPEPEPNSEAALAAEAAATEPAEEEGEDVDYTPTPETAGLTTDDATATEDAPAPAPTRSLFANLTKPTN